MLTKKHWLKSNFTHYTLLRVLMTINTYIRILEKLAALQRKELVKLGIDTPHSKLIQPAELHLEYIYIERLKALKTQYEAENAQ